mgnify:CR=1 FL=1
MVHRVGESASTIEVELTNTQTVLPVDTRHVHDLVRQALAAEGVERASISILIVDDATIREINRNHLGHDWETDVITFPLSEPDEEPLAGELIISAEMARNSAEEVGEDPWAEMALYLVHGLLHLRGHDDQSESDALKMRRREDEILTRLGLKNLYSLIGQQTRGQEVEPQ